MKKALPSITVGIPTYYGGPALVKAVKSILASKGVGKLRLIVNVDGNPLAKEIEEQLKKMGVDVVFSPKRGGQVARIKQIIGLCHTDLLILTQDDIYFPPDSLVKIITAFKKKPDVTMISARLFPHPAKTFFESIIETGVRLTHKVGDLWNNGDNYLLSSGRCLAFRTKFIKTFNIPIDVINSDAHLYFENKYRRGKFLALKDAIVYNKSPQTLKEHLKQSRKFQNSSVELSKYFPRRDLTREYDPSLHLILKAYLDEFVSRPLKTTIYLLVLAYTRLAGKNMYANVKKFWETDVSTKKI